MKTPDELGDVLTAALGQLRRTSVVVGVSGGIDSAVTLALAVRTLGPENVHAFALPERENSPSSVKIASAICEQLGVPLHIRDMTEALVGLGTYERRDNAIRGIFETYQPGIDRFAMALVQNLRGDTLPARYEGVLTHPNGEVERRRVRAGEYRAIFAASSSKQRIRTLALYEAAEATWSAVLGTSNWDETFLGFFVKLGDGSWDICLLNEMTKQEVFELGRQLRLPDAVLTRTTTTDTFPDDGGSQTEMFYSLPFSELDVVLDVMRGGVTKSDALSLLNWTEVELENAILNLERRNRSTAWNRAAGIGVAP